jgi:hypothetical protein
MGEGQIGKGPKKKEKHVLIHQSMCTLAISKGRLQDLLDEVKGAPCEAVTGTDTPPPGLAEILVTLPAEIDSISNQLDKIREELREALF